MYSEKKKRVESIKMLEKKKIDTENTRMGFRILNL